MGRKRKSIEVEVTPSPKRVTRSCTKSGASVASPHPEDSPKGEDALPERLGRKRKSCTKLEAGVVYPRDTPKGKDALADGSPYLNRDEKDVRKKGSTKKLMFITSKLGNEQKDRISNTGFGGLMEIKYSSVHEKLSSWLVRVLDTKRAELVIPYRGSIKVDADAVNRVFGIPMGTKCIEYQKKSGDDSFFGFYKMLGHETDQRAPTFVEAEKMLIVDGKGKFDDKWLQIWLLFAVSSFLCPTSCTSLCVRGFHAIFKVEEIKQYNWCQLVIDRLLKGVKDFKARKKFVSGCLFFLTILYLDSLNIPEFVDQNEKVRAKVWTEDKVARAIALDKSSENDFEKLPLKAEFAMSNTTPFIQPQMFEDFVNANFSSTSITVSKETMKQAFHDFSQSINHAVINLWSQLCQLPSNTTNGGAGTSNDGAAVTGPATLAGNTAFAGNKHGAGVTGHIEPVAADANIASHAIPSNADTHRGSTRF